MPTLHMETAPLPKPPRSDGLDAAQRVMLWSLESKPAMNDITSEFRSAVVWSLRMATAGGLATACCIWPWVSTWLPSNAPSFLAVVFSLFACERSLGASVKAAFIGFSAVVFAAAMANLTFLIVGRSRFGAGVALFVVSFGFGFVQASPVFAKLGLALYVVIVIVFATAPASDPLPPNWGWTIVPWGALGFATAVLSLVVPVPSTASQRIKRHSIAASRSLCSLFCGRFELFVAPPLDFRRAVIKLKNEQTEAKAREHLAELRTALANEKWEAPLMWLLGRGQRRHARMAKYAALLNQLMTNLNEADIDALHCEQQHRDYMMVQDIERPLRAVATELEVLLSALAASATSYSSVPWFQVIIKQHTFSLGQAMVNLDRAYTRTRQAHVYDAGLNYTLGDFLRVNQHIYLAATVVADAQYIIRDTLWGSNPMTATSTAAAIATAASAFARGRSSAASNPPAQTAPYQASFAVLSPDADQEDPAPRLPDRPPSLLRPAILRLLAAARCAGRALLNPIELDWPKHPKAARVGALKCAVSIVVASLVALIPRSQDTFDQSYWCALTVAFIWGHSRAATFSKALERFQGTVSGAVFGSVMVKLAGSFDQVRDEILFTSLAMAGWCFVCGFVRSTPAHSYAGLVAAFTAGIILVGFDRSSNLTRDEYVLARIENTSLGILVWLTAFHVLSGERASEQMNTAMREAVCGVAEAADVLGDLLDCTNADEVPGLVDKILQLQRHVLASVDTAKSLGEESASEPRLWHASFAQVRPKYQQLCEGCRRMARSVANMATSLHDMHCANNRVLSLVLQFSSFQRDQKNVCVLLRRIKDALHLIENPGRLPGPDVAVPGSTRHRLFTDTIRGLALNREPKPFTDAQLGVPAGEPAGERVFADISEEWTVKFGSAKGRQQAGWQRPSDSETFDLYSAVSSPRHTAGASSPRFGFATDAPKPEPIAEAAAAPTMQNSDVVFISPFILSHIKLVDDANAASRDARDLLIGYLISNGVSLEHLPGAVLATDADGSVSLPTLPFAQVRSSAL